MNGWNTRIRRQTIVTPFGKSEREVVEVVDDYGRPYVPEPRVEWCDLALTDPDVALAHRALENAHQHVSEGLWCSECGDNARHVVAMLRNHRRLSEVTP